MRTGRDQTKPLEIFTFPVEMRKSVISDINWRYWGLGAASYLALFTIVITFASSDPFLTPRIPFHLLELSQEAPGVEEPYARSATLAIPDWFRTTDQSDDPSRIPSVPDSPASPNSDAVASAHLEPAASGRNRNRSSSSSRIDRQAAIEILRSSIGDEFSGLAVNSEAAPASFPGSRNEELLARMDNFDGVTARTASDLQSQLSDSEAFSDPTIGRSTRSANSGKVITAVTGQRMPTDANEDLKIMGVEGLSGDVVIEDTMVDVTGDNPVLGIVRSPGDIMIVVRRNAGQLKNKYLQILKMNPNLTGELTLRITIEPNGRVRHIELISESLHDSGFVRTIMALIKGWRFGRSDGGITSTTLTLPFSAK